MYQRVIDMKATFGTTKKGTWAYIQKSVRIDGKPTTKTHLEASVKFFYVRENYTAAPRELCNSVAGRVCYLCTRKI